MKRNSFNVGEVHSFSRTLAREHGVNAALLMAFLAHRITAVEAARKDDRGFYMSAKVIKKHYPYLSIGQVQNALTKLRKKGVLHATRHNRKAYDKTLWYKFVNPSDQKSALEDPVSFRVEDAVKYGPEAALISRNIQYWIAENQKKDNRYVWHRLSPKALTEHLPVPERTIRRCLERMCAGPTAALERRRGSGFDQAHEYRLLLAPIREWPNQENHRPKSEMDRPKCHIEWPNQEIEWPKQETYTPLEDTFGKTTIGKNPLEKPVKEHTASGVVYALTQTQGRDDNEIIALSSLPPAMYASGLDSGRDVSDAPKPNVSRNAESKATLSMVTLLSDGASEVPLPAESENLPELDAMGSASLSGKTWFGVVQNHFTPDRIRAQDIVEYERRCTDFASPYADYEDEHNLTPDQKMRVFRAAIYSRIKIGGVGARRPCGIIYSKASFETAKRFFALNPEIPVSNVLSAIESCLFTTEATGPKEDGEYDEVFYQRRAANLDFFFKHLPQLCAGGEGFFSLIGCTFLDEDGGDLQIYMEALKKAEKYA